MGNKTIGLIFQATNWRNLTVEDMTWLRKGNVKRNTECLLIAVQNNVVRINNVTAKRDKTQKKCWLCVDKNETINHVISECRKLLQREQLSGIGNPLGIMQNNINLAIRTNGM